MYLLTFCVRAATPHSMDEMERRT